MDQQKYRKAPDRKAALLWREIEPGWRLISQWWMNSSDVWGKGVTLEAKPATVQIAGSDTSTTGWFRDGSTSTDGRQEGFRGQLRVETGRWRRRAGCIR